MENTNARRQKIVQPMSTTKALMREFANITKPFEKGFSGFLASGFAYVEAKGKENISQIKKL